MSADDPFVELRGDVPREHVDVIDAVVQATPGATRTSVMRQIIAEWVERELHRATLVCRIANSNGSAAETERNRTGSTPARGRR